MVQKKTFTKKQLETLSAEAIIEKIQNENYSLLTTLGGEKLRKEMVPIGKACHTIANYFIKTSGPKKNEAEHNLNARKKMGKTMKRFAPVEYDKSAFKNVSEKGLVIGFNHPSLGEILRLVALKMDIYPDKIMLFPVNLPWYEAMAKDYKELLKLGIIITPTITPSTWDKLGLEPDTKTYESAKRIKTEFRHIYTKQSHDIVKNGGVIFVAPSATRQATVFKNKACFEKTEEIIPTMSMLALKLYSDKEMDCDFLGVAVLPPEKYKRNLNLGKKYKLIATKPMTAEYIKKTYFKVKEPKKLIGFDHDFLSRIAEKLPKKFRY